MKENILKSYIDLHVSKDELLHTTLESIKKSTKFNFWKMSKIALESCNSQTLADSFNVMSLGLTASLLKYK